MLFADRNLGSVVVNSRKEGVLLVHVLQIETMPERCRSVGVETGSMPVKHSNLLENYPVTTRCHRILSWVRSVRASVDYYRPIEVKL